MSDSVLDMIDNVVARHGDAMRWSPNADPPMPAWTAMVTQPPPSPVDGERMARAFTAFNQSLTRLLPVVRDLTTALQILVPRLVRRHLDEQERQRVRRSAMHSAYHRRRR